MDTERFDLPVAVTLRLQSRAGNVDVIAEPREDVLVEGHRIETRTDAESGQFQIRCGHGSKPFSVRCPVGTDIVVGTQSGDVRLLGDFGIVSVTTLSGKIDVQSADEADLRNTSASITIGACRGRCRMNSVSGKIAAGRVGSTSAGTMSGSIHIDLVAGALKARSVSGSIDCSCDAVGAIKVKTVSGKVHIMLPSGTGIATRFKTLSGKVHNPFPPGTDCFIEAMSISGSIDLVPG